MYYCNVSYRHANYRYKKRCSFSLFSVHNKEDCFLWVLPFLFFPLIFLCSNSGFFIFFLLLSKALSKWAIWNCENNFLQLISKTWLRTSGNWILKIWKISKFNFRNVESNHMYKESAHHSLFKSCYCQRAFSIDQLALVQSFPSCFEVQPCDRTYMIIISEIEQYLLIG